MVTLRTIRWGVLMLSMTVYAAAQDTTQSQSQPQTPAPAPAFGQTAPILNPDNPPLSGLDEPSLELKTASRSFISPALQVSQSGDSNAANQLGGSDLQPVTRVLGALDLQKFWPKSDLFLEYLGGGAFYEDPYDTRQLQAFGFEGITRWRTGLVTLRDSFNYAPDGAFQFGYGGVPGFGFATGTGVSTGLPGIHVAEPYGTVGNTPRLSNTGSIDIIQAITPRSAFTLIGAFSDAHFFQNTLGLDNSDQTTIEAGYSHLLSRHDQIALVYAFQLFQFPDSAGGEIFNHVVNIRWSHTISGRMSLVLAVGPQYTDLRYGTSTSNWSPTGRADLHYKFERASLVLGYEKYVSSGSGFLAGANTQVARLSIRRPLGRTFDAYGDAAFSHNSQLQTQGNVASPATSYNEGSAGLLVRKHLGRSYDAFLAYRFAEIDFNEPPVQLGNGTSKLSQRNIGTIGLEWHPKPTRIE